MEPFPVILLSLLLGTAVFTDLKEQRIPNWLTFSSLPFSFGYHLFFYGMNGFLLSLAGMFIGTAFFLLPYIKGGMGAGDAKLMGAVGAMLGPKGVFYAFLFTGLAGGIYALGIMFIYSSFGRDYLRRSKIELKTYLYTREYMPVEADEVIEKPRLCYGVAIAVGTFVYIMLKSWGYQFPF